ncbi:MAG: fibronectin type III domain-containing protein [Candidatus Peregrinibacteria bacterium]
MTPSLALPRRSRLAILLPALLVIGMLAAPTLQAAAPSSMGMFLRPHCEASSNNDVQPCPTFEVADPQTQKTPALKVDDVLDMDLVIQNPTLRNIVQARAWIAYNPSILEGISIEPVLPIPTPGTNIFSQTDGFIVLEDSATTGQEPWVKEVIVARIKMRVKAIPESAGPDVLSFFDVKLDGHTTLVVKKTPTENEGVELQMPGALLLIFDSEHPTAPIASSSQQNAEGGISDFVPNPLPLAMNTPAASSPSSTTGTAIVAVCGNGIIETGEECDDGNLFPGDLCSSLCAKETAASSSSHSTAAALLPDGSVCAKNSDCRSALCTQSVCRGDVIKIPEGGACLTGNQCLKGSCTNGLCSMSSARSSSPAGQPTRTSFTTLQIQNLRLTTQGSTVALAWDPLPSAQLKAYTIYYGTTSGRYIQRRTVTSSATDYALHALPEKVTYYFAIRALNAGNEESAFSQEVAIEVGNPKSSTSPLTGRIVSDKQGTTVSGETGASSDLALILLLAAVAGTILASRRQIIALRQLPDTLHS